MFAKSVIILSILGLLAACSAQPPMDAATPSPSTQVEISPSPEAAASPPPSPSPPGFDCGSFQEIPLEECQALLAMYESTNGDSWLDNSGWLDNQTPCSWTGVICLGGHVAELQLYYNNLSGSLPPEIGNFSQLKSLYLDRSQLSGPIPPEIGKLTKLEVVRLGGNQFTSLPVELANLKNLAFLELWGNQLSGEIPSELGNLTQLQMLDLHSNEFTGSIPPELGTLTNLKNLNLSRNQLDGPIPTELASLYVLNELNLSFNQLTGSIPEEFGDLLYLYFLDLSYNQLSGEVPAALSKAPLSELRLWGNQLDGTIPVSKEQSTKVDYEGVQFEIGPELAESIWQEIVKAQPPVAGGPGWDVRPAHTRFTIVGPREQSYMQSSRVGMAAQPQILIFPAREYGGMSEFAKAEIDAMQSLLEARPAISEDKLPLLPLINASQVFHVQEKYLDFQNGSGVRFITQYSQDMAPITNQNIFYTFQGLTRDGNHYIAAYFPITAKGLGDEPVVEDWDAFAAGYQDYLKQSMDNLNALSPEEFEPDLEALDQVIQSLLVETP